MPKLDELGPPVRTGTAVERLRSHLTADRFHVSGTTGVLVLLIGLSWLALRLLVLPPHVDVTDLGRDLIGARAAIEGHTAYQTLGAIEDLVAGVDVPSAGEPYWVAHTPFSIALARLLWSAVGEASESVATVVSVGATALLMLYRPPGSRFDWPVRFLLAGALALSFGMTLDVFWLQGASLLGLALAIVFTLSVSGRRALALSILGLCVAWRPWCAPLAVCLPRSRSSLKDTIWVGAVAGVATLASLPAVGGFSALADWTRLALPANLADTIGLWFNGALLAKGIGATLSLLLLGVVTVALLRADLGLTTSQKPAAVSLGVLALFPLVWPPHWIALYPALVHDRPQEGAVVVGFSLLMLANAPAVAASTSLFWWIASAAAIGLLLVWLRVERESNSVAVH